MGEVVTGLTLAQPPPGHDDRIYQHSLVEELAEPALPLLLVALLGRVRALPPAVVVPVVP
jgi:hypothetical protein